MWFQPRGLAAGQASRRNSERRVESDAGVAGA
jgi:hypothetical protein